MLAFFKESYFLLSYNISRHALRVYGQHVKSKMADQNEEDTSPAADIVVTKYKMAGDMVNGEGNINLISSLRIFSLIETRFSYLFIVHSTKKGHQRAMLTYSHVRLHNETQPV